MADEKRYAGGWMIRYADYTRDEVDAFREDVEAAQARASEREVERKVQAGIEERVREADRVRTMLLLETLKAQIGREVAASEPGVKAQGAATELCKAPRGTYDGVEGGRPYCPVPCPHEAGVDPIAGTVPFGDAGLIVGLTSDADERRDAQKAAARVLAERDHDGVCACPRRPRCVPHATGASGGVDRIAHCEPHVHNPLPDDLAASATASLRKDTAAQRTVTPTGTAGTVPRGGVYFSPPLEPGIWIRFDGPPGPTSGHFIETENEKGQGLGGPLEPFGWVQQGPDWMLGPFGRVEIDTDTYVPPRAQLTTPDPNPKIERVDGRPMDSDYAKGWDAGVKYALKAIGRLLEPGELAWHWEHREVYVEGVTAAKDMVTTLLPPFEPVSFDGAAAFEPLFHNVQVGRLGRKLTGRLKVEFDLPDEPFEPEDGEPIYVRRPI